MTKYAITPYAIHNDWYGRKVCSLLLFANDGLANMEKIMSTKEYLLKAREHIMAKRYQEAREILYQVDHPTAHKWLAKLDEIDPQGIPEDPFAPIPAAAEPESPDWIKQARREPGPLSKSSEPLLTSNYQKKQNSKDKIIPMPLALAIIAGFVALCVCSSIGMYVFYQASETLDSVVTDSEPALDLDSGFGSPIQFGDSVNGYLSDSSPLQNYRFAANEGDMIVVTMRSADFDSLLELYDADGNFMSEDDDSGGDLDAQIIYTIPRSGEYIVSATEWWSEIGIVGGNYTLTLQRQ